MTTESFLIRTSGNRVPSKRVTLPVGVRIEAGALKVTKCVPAFWKLSTAALPTARSIGVCEIRGDITEPDVRGVEAKRPSGLSAGRGGAGTGHVGGGRRPRRCGHSVSGG